MTNTATAPTKPPRTRKAGSKSPTDKKGTTNGQMQAAAPIVDVTKPVRKSGGTKDGLAALKGSRARMSGQEQPKGGDDQGSAGASGAGKIENAGQSGGDGEMRGGTKQVLMTEVKLPGRGGRPQGEEEYPFGDLPFAKKVGGEIVGLSFFIPDADGPDSHLATARKRHKPIKFWSRATMEKHDGAMTKGLRVWKAPLDA